MSIVARSRYLAATSDAVDPGRRISADAVRGESERGRLRQERAAERLLPPLFLILTFVTGVVDAASFLRLGHIFVANMTGNVVFLGFGLAGASGVSIWASIAALVAFLLGALVGGRVANGNANDPFRLLMTTTGLQAALAAVAVVLAVSEEPTPTGNVRYALIAVLALTMGVQSAAARNLAVADLTTTVLTQTITGVASDSQLARGSGSRIGRRGAGVVSMLLGAVAGGLLVLHVDDAAPLGLALILLLAVACASSPTASRRGGMSP
jgi:uncharacterized membrane protein YoaK (UPF0700 family)